MTELDPAEVINEVAHHRFTLNRDGHESELVYDLRGTQLILVHTGVPPELRGKGVGGVLVEAAVEWARRDGLILVPLCPYARQWLQGHGEISSTVRIDWSTPSESG